MTNEQLRRIGLAYLINTSYGMYMYRRTVLELSPKDAILSVIHVRHPLSIEDIQDAVIVGILEDNPDSKEILEITD